jgi:hypothetical protein
VKARSDTVEVAAVMPHAAPGRSPATRPGAWLRGVRRWDAAWLLGLAFLAYLPASVIGYFRSDDFNLAALHQPGSAVHWRLLWEALICRVPASDYFYRPVGYVFLAGGYAAWGPSPVGYFVVNQTVHALTGLLVWATVRELGWGRGSALMAGAAFLLHPLHAEAVWWVVGSFDLLAGLFASIALWAHVRWLRHGGTAPVVGVIIGYALAIFAKEAAITLPAALGVASALRDPAWSRRTWTQHLGLHVALGVVAGGLLLARHGCLGRWVGRYPVGLSPADPVAALAGIPKLLYFLLVPAPWPTAAGQAWLVLLVAAVSGGLLLAALLVAGGIRVTAWCLGATLFLSLPVVAIVGILDRPTDLGRIFLLPAVGMALLVGHAWARLPGRLAQGVVGSVLLTWALLVAAYQQPLAAGARLTRLVVTEVERAARQSGISAVVVVGLPPTLFGEHNWAFSRATARPFAAIPRSVTVRLAAERPLAQPAGTRVLVWNPGKAVLETDGR